jgi:hypothetical protein
MNAGTLCDIGAPTTEVRIYRDHRLVVREVCESPEEVGALVEQASDLDHVYLRVRDASPDLGPGDVVAREMPMRAGKNLPLASQRLPGYGTE